MADVSMNNTENNNTPGRSTADSVATRRRRRRINLMSKKSGEGCVDDGKRPKLELGNPELMAIAKEFQHQFNIEFKVEIPNPMIPDVFPKFGAYSLCGKRRYMEDAISIHPSFCKTENENSSAIANIHYFGVYDGHGCSHVASRCKEFLHLLVKEEILNDNKNVGWRWEEYLKQSFKRMDMEATTPYTSMSLTGGAPCRCELQHPEFDAVGSAVIVAILTPNKIVISNCGDCRAVLCRKGMPIPLSVDHKPDRPDELHRIQAAGGRVLSWHGPRVEGVLAMSRAIGDKHLKPFVSCEPEVTILDRTEDDQFLILASDGLWDAVSNEDTCAIVRSCFKLGRARRQASAETETETETETPEDETYDLTCFKVSNFLAKLAVARGSGDNVSVIVINLKKS